MSNNINSNINTCAACDELFLDYFENTLSDVDRAQFDKHVSSCVRCQSLIRDVNGIRDEAAALPDMVPSRELWSDIEARIQPQVRSIATARPYSVSRTWLAAAAAVLIVATSGVTYLAMWRSIARPSTADAPATIVAAPQVAMAPEEVKTPEPTESEKQTQASSSGTASHHESAASSIQSRSDTRTSLASASSAPAPVTAAELAFAGEITQLQHVLVERRDQLDPETVKVVEDNLKLIDTAVKRARSALAKDPASGFLTRQLDNALQKKVELLRTVALLPAST